MRSKAKSPTHYSKEEAGFNVPMAQWLAGPMNGLMKTLLSPKRVRMRGLWKPAMVQKLITEHEARHRDHSRTLWALMLYANERYRNGRAA